ncbi:hypothetical protein [Desulfatitalea tepidiphila]|uniref:hypothetical protein n=1 Tax=Desulfatitalea tepidiphila TaxID=1185843 RepID=UPI0006B66027|nr:hypothetical protein [Desulfatitalea tepidiphila]
MISKTASESFPEFHIPVLQREAKKWAKIHPEIFRVSLYICHEPEKYGFKYLIKWDVTQIPKELNSQIDFLLKEEKYFSGTFVACYKDLPNFGYQREWHIDISVLDNHALSHQSKKNELHEKKKVIVPSDHPETFVSLVDIYLEDPKIVLYNKINIDESLTEEVSNTGANLQLEDDFNNQLDQLLEQAMEPVEAIWRTMVRNINNSLLKEESREKLRKNALFGLKNYARNKGGCLIAKEDIDSKDLYSWSKDPRKKFKAGVLQRLVTRVLPHQKSYSKQRLFERYQRLKKLNKSS